MKLTQCLGKRPYLIAEAGVNHNGNVELARNLVLAAAENGADAVKFQMFNPDKLVTPLAQKADYQKKTTGKGSQIEMLRKLVLDNEVFRELSDLARSCGIDYIVTPFDKESALFLNEIIDIFKIGSGDLTWHDSLKFIAGFGKPMILSTGMATLGDVEGALDAIASVMGERIQRDLYLLHCTSQYPAPADSVNLRAIATLSQAFGLMCGFSDHTEGIEIPLAAAALGVPIIEKHFTLDKSMEGPDHKASIEPTELKALSSGIERISLALGSGIKKPAASELNTAAVARRSFVTKEPMKKGQIINTGKLEIMRPGTGISPVYGEFIEGMILLRDKEPWETLDWKDFKSTGEN
ncbi:N-acetylneuraminate synthase family protein [Myxococcota bacterium]|nr:N-acetylneuraminate synthase family protein [Myxococcota bacterium]MBU1382429.1 N-acetylneuraminate synthase family protein [Myxococcota bacterium]MBU1497551.1 N-acetylneuraminate synthase family protein [Myxococcota bacterium]